LVDGQLRKSLHTNKKGLAQHRLEQYIKGEFGIGAELTVQEYYDKWIVLREAEEAEGLIRKSTVRDYRQHFSSRILPELGGHWLGDIDVSTLNAFRSTLLKTVTLKTARNIIDGSFRAMWRAVRKDKLTREDPFELLEWPARIAPKPDPFTAEERERIIAWWRDNDFFYFPWVSILFDTGMRPSEAAALRWTDVDLEMGTISISKSRNLGADGPPKTKHSGRVIIVPFDVVALLKIMPSRDLGLDYQQLGEGELGRAAAQTL
jgi:integrase